MKYIRIKNGIVGICTHEDNKNVRIKYRDKVGNHCPMFSKKGVSKVADTIEELCDEFVSVRDNWHDHWLDFEDVKILCSESEIYGAIWTNKGLIYVAKMNDKGELELI